MDLLEQRPLHSLLPRVQLPVYQEAKQEVLCAPPKSYCRPQWLVRDHPKCSRALGCRLLLETTAQGSVPRLHPISIPCLHQDLTSWTMGRRQTAATFLLAAGVGVTAILQPIVGAAQLLPLSILKGSMDGANSHRQI